MLLLLLLPLLLLLLSAVVVGVVWCCCCCCCCYCCCCCCCCCCYFFLSHARRTDGKPPLCRRRGEHATTVTAEAATGLNSRMNSRMHPTESKRKEGPPNRWNTPSSACNASGCQTKDSAAWTPARFGCRPQVRKNEPEGFSSCAPTASLRQDPPQVTHNGAFWKADTAGPHPRGWQHTPTP